MDFVKTLSRAKRELIMNKGNGILLHLTSLPSKYGIGDFGPAAYRFVDFLSDSGQKYWQILPLNPTDQMFSNSPYSSFAAFGNNTLLISPEGLVDKGWLTKKDIASAKFKTDSVDYKAVTLWKEKILDVAYHGFEKSGGASSEDYLNFCKEESYWLEDFALFSLIKTKINSELWNLWPAELRDRDQNALNDLKEKHINDIQKIKFFQYVFIRQWMALKEYCNQKGISVFGDIPIYVGLDSVDVWTCPHMFKLDQDKNPTGVSGVPPDYFSETGQRWGNPLYDWDRLKEEGFQWWIDRIRHNLRLFDIVRIDHFRGLVAYWEIPPNEETAINGWWVNVPCYELFDKVKEQFPQMPIIAEDLGIITDDVVAVMDHFGFQGMKILLFAFNGDMNTHPYLPHNFHKRCVVYTGTHDNNTVCGWYNNEATGDEKNNMCNYTNKGISSKDVHTALMELASKSSAEISIFPLQDVLGLDQNARMNTPGTTVNNWEWRFNEKVLTKKVCDYLKKLAEETGR